MNWRLPVALALVLMLGGCAVKTPRKSASAPPHKPAPANHTSPRIAAWPLLSMIDTGADMVLLKDGNRDAAIVSGDSVSSAARAAQKLTAAAGWTPEFLVAQGSQPNAFAFYDDGTPTVAVTLGLVDLLGSDEAAWAAIFGHEMAHFALRHREIRAERQETAAATSSLLGIGLTIIGVPFGGLVADAASTAVERGYDRDEERHADAAGVALMVVAGYDADGAVRMQTQLMAAGGQTPLPFFSTHPIGEDRVARMQALVAKVREQGAGALPLPPPVATIKPLK
jgi:Zn-dependent protease with chaperone function